MRQLKENLSVGSYMLLKGGMLLLLFCVDACVHEPFIDPSVVDAPTTTPTTNQGGGTDCLSNGKVCFESSILPIFLSSCAKSGCHDAGSRREGYVLNSYSNIVRNGISPGNAQQSKLYTVLFASGESRMPPDGPLTQAQKDSIKAWINQGAKNTVNCNCTCDPTQFGYAAIVAPILANSCVGCHKPGALSGNIDLSTYAAVKIQANNGKLLGSVQHASGFVAMPQGGKLQDCQITQIASWIDAGIPNN